MLRAGSAGGGGGSAAAGGAGASLGMAFKLMDRIKEERDQLKAENAALKARIALGGGKTPLEQLLEHADLAPSTRKAVQSLPPKLQDTLAADLLRWNLRAPTDVHGNPFDINRRAMHIAKKLKEAPTPTAGSTNAAPAAAHHHHHAHHTKHPAVATDSADAAAADSADGPITDVAALASPPLSRTVTTLQAEEAALEAPRRKKIVVAKSSMSDEDEDMDRANAAMRAGAAGRASSGSNQALSSVISPQSEIDEEENDVLSPLSDERDRAATAASVAEVASIDTNPLSSSLLSQTNRLIFQEDSPLYRQQLQLQRLRVAQMFAKLDSLSERTSHFAQAALAFSQAAESLAAHLNKGWEDIETNEVIDEAEAIKMDQKRAAAAAAAASSSVATAASASSDESSPSTAAAAVSGSTVAAAPSSSSASKPSASPTGSSSASSGSSSSPFLLPSGPSRIGGSSGGTLTSPLKIPQMQQQQPQQQQRTLSHSPSPSPPPFLASAAASTSSAAPAQSHARHPSVLSTSSSAASAASSAAAAASASPRSASRAGSEDPLSLGFSMGKLSAIVGCLGSVANNLGMFVSHLLVTAINSIGRKYRQEAKQSMLLMERLLLEYEEKLSTYLRKKHRDRQRLLNMTNIFGKKKVHDEELMFLAALRRELELRRMEHVEVLNSIQTLRRLELVEVVNASFMSFVTFFHEGDFLAQELRKEIEPLSSAILRRKRFYESHFKEIADLKLEIKSAALPLNLAKIFSAPACLPIGMSAADWVANMTNAASNTMATAGGAAAAAVAGAAPSTAVVSAGSSSPSLGPASSPNDAHNKLVFSNIGHASLIYTIPGIGVAASLTKPAQVQGYLRTQTRDGKSWKRRWHVLEKGTFFYLREAVFLAPRLIVNVLTCGARPVIKHDLDFMFELISPTRTILYQAESELEMKTWVACFQNSTEYLLSLQHTRNDTENLERSMDTKSIQREKHLKQGLLATLRHDNQHCAECGTKEPDWISINLGVMICIVSLAQQTERSSGESLARVVCLFSALSVCSLSPLSGLFRHPSFPRRARLESSIDRARRFGHRVAGHDGRAGQ